MFAGDVHVMRGNTPAINGPLGKVVFAREEVISLQVSVDK